MPEFHKWKSINKFTDAYKKAQKYEVDRVTYRGKIKLHGTNAGIHFDLGVAFPQKRSGFIDEYDDNCEFAKFVSELEVFGRPDCEIFYGEWAGPGVQKNDAVTQIAEKSFFIFSIYDLYQQKIIVDPDQIAARVRSVFGTNYRKQNIYVIPWCTEPTTVKFTSNGDCQRFISAVTDYVDNTVAQQDPYIKQMFDVSGPGEGVVMYPVDGYHLDGQRLSDENVFDYIFKVKTESHSVHKMKNRNSVIPEKPEGIDDFIESFFTEQRFEQMLNQIGGEATREKTGQFIKAVMGDVHKESQQEILLADFEWKDVPKYATPVVKQWWFARCDKLN